VAWLDADLQLGLTIAHALSMGGVDGIEDAMELDPQVLRIRFTLESWFEADLREALAPPSGDLSAEAVTRRLLELSHPQDAPLSRFLAREATNEQYREFVAHRSLYTLREADPHTFAIPRLSGPAKVALVEIQYDEYGSGDPTRMHSTIFAQMMEALGLDARHGAYLDLLPAHTLATVNMLSMFGLQRRLRGCAIGHLALFELTSSLPSRWLGNGLRRLGYGERATSYYDEHVEADSVHDQIALHDVVGSLLEHEPGLAADVLLGAEALAFLEGLWAEHLLDAWRSGSSSLLGDITEVQSFGAPYPLVSTGA
jgi:hypothetical protein